jgi:flagellar hook-associated protein 3 FlgL
MAITPYTIPFPAGSLAARRSGDLFVGMRRELDDLQRQMATGQKAQSFGGLGLERRSSLDFRGKLSAIDGYMAAIKDAQLRVTLMTQGLERFSAMAGSTKGELLPPKFDPGAGGRTSAQVAAEDRLKLAIDILNSDIAGRHVFAGRASEKPPVIDYKTMMEGDATRLGLKGMIAERLAVDQGGGLAQATLASASGGGLESLTIATTDANRYGIKVSGLSESMTNVALPGTANAAGVTAAAGLTTAQLDFSGIPNAGEGFELQVELPDGTVQSLSFTAVVGPPGPGEFQIGANAAITRDNASAAVAAALNALTLSDDFRASSSIAAAEEFFAQSPGTPIPGGTYSRPVALWYVGDDDTASVPDGRDTAPVRADASYVVAAGARANEAPLRNFLAQLGALAAASFTNDVPGRQRYEALADKLRANLAPADPAKKIEGMVMELGAAAASMNAAKDRHQATDAVLQDALAQNEEAKPEAVAAAILALQTRLQASYQTTSILARLSIVNYL